jgi:signal transduction histidine kinase
MNIKRGGSAGPAVIPDTGRQPLEKRLFALDALAKLAKQFSEKPDFRELMSILLMTLCGQFSTGDCLALLKRPRSGVPGRTFFATGGFRRCGDLAALDITRENSAALLGGDGACKIKDLDLSDRHSGIVPALAAAEVSVVCPMVHDEQLIGMIGIGERVNGRPFSPDDMALLVAIVGTITPFLANTYLFWEIQWLNAWYLEVLNSVRQGVYVFDRENRLKKINAPGLEILDNFRSDSADAGSLYGKPIEEVFPPDAFGVLLREAMTSGGGADSGDVRSVVARSGAKERVYNMRLSESSEGGDGSRDLIITLDDITHQKESDQRLYSLQQLADRGVMASSISHELRNFLGLVLGGLEMTQIAVMQGDGDKANENLDKLKANVENLERFTSGLMDHTKLVIDKKTTDLNTVISDVISFVSGQQRFKGIVIGPDLDAELSQMALDPDQIAQLLLNLLNNGADAIKEAGRSEGVINVATRQEDDEALLIVSDNGVGMAPEIRDGLFKSRLTTKEHGHGYGLVTCAGIIESHNATVSIDSTPGEGSTFTIRFPAPQSPDPGVS